MKDYEKIIKGLVLEEFAGVISKDDQTLINELKQDPEFWEVAGDLLNFLHTENIIRAVHGKL